MYFNLGIIKVYSIIWLIHPVLTQGGGGHIIHREPLHLGHQKGAQEILVQRAGGGFQLAVTTVRVVQEAFQLWEKEKR